VISPAQQVEVEGHSQLKEKNLGERKFSPPGNVCARKDVDCREWPKWHNPNIENGGRGTPCGNGKKGQCGVKPISFTNANKDRLYSRKKAQVPGEKGKK